MDEVMNLDEEKLTYDRITTQGVDGHLEVAGFTRDPEPGCHQPGVKCMDLTIVLPSVTTVENVVTKVVATRYYLSYHGNYPPGMVPANTEGEWCKIYEASQTWQDAGNLRRQLVIKALLKNWSNKYPCNGRLEVDWIYSKPDV